MQYLWLELPLYDSIKPFTKENESIDSDNCERVVTIQIFGTDEQKEKDSE